MKNWKKLSMIAFASAFAVSGVLGGTMLVGGNADAATSATNINNATLNIVAHDRKENHGELPNNPVAYPNDPSSRYVRFSWDEIEYVDLTANIPDSYKGQAPYSYSLTVEYYQRYIADVEQGNVNFDDDSVDKTGVRPPKAVVRDVFTGENLTSLLNIEDMRYYFDCHPEDKNLSFENAQNKKHKDHGGDWGIYRFILTINGRDQIKSDYVVVEPVKPSTTVKPNLLRADASSNSSMDTAHRFTITNPDYKYADKYTIKWFVTGEGVDGKQYVLTPEDLQNAPSGTKSIFDGPIERYGTEFYFDSNRIGGTWSVYCEVTDAKTQTRINVSDVYTVNTVAKMKPNVLIWCLIAGGVVLLGIIIFIIVKSVKKEKVY